MLISKIHHFGNILPKLIFLLLLSMGMNAQIVQDSSFEAGQNNPYWQDSSVTFSTVICDVVTCGNCQGLCGPLSGSYYLLLGGGNQGPETSWAEQNVFIPKAETATLIFYLKVPKFDLASSSYCSTKLDSNSLFTVTPAGADPYKFGYEQVKIDISTYADSNFHLLQFYCNQNYVTQMTYFLIDDVTIELTTGIEKTEIELSPMEVYPNPSTGLFKVEFSSILQGEMEYRIYDNAGKLLQKQNFQPLHQQLEVDLNQYPAGIYHLQVLHNNQVYHTKLLVQ